MIVSLDQEAPRTDTGLRKRHHHGDGGPYGLIEANDERGFIKSLCFTEASYFDRFPLSVSPADAREIEEIHPSAYVKQLANDGPSVVRVLEMAQVLAQGETISAVALKRPRLPKNRLRISCGRWRLC